MLAQALAAQDSTITISGNVRDSRSGEPVAAVSVVRNGLVVAVTDETGAFQTQEMDIEGRVVTLLFRRIGYATTAHDVDVPPGESSVQVDVVIAASATGLEEVVVQGERVVLTNPDLAGFYERREQDFGRYLTQEEIERLGGSDLRSQLRRLRVSFDEPDPRDPFAGPTFESCIVAYLDGVRLMDLSAINEWIPPTQLGGIEYYADERWVRLPMEFKPPGHCGIILFWSKELQRPSPVEFGIRAGYQPAGDFGGGIVGGQFIVPVRRGYSAVHLHGAFDAMLGDQRDRWRMSVDISLRPLGYSSPWYVGLGGALAKTQPTEETPGDISIRPSILTGLRARVGVLRPFAELRVLDPFRFSQTAVLTLIGVNLRFGVQ